MSFTFGLIGYPIKHSLSPWIHEQFLKRCQLKGSYSIIEIDPANDFTKEIEQLKKKKLNGFNVTVPYKEKIIPYLDEIDDQAKHIGAVNTVLYEDGKWIGYNTDGLGYVKALETKYPTLKERKEASRILILGAGGAAKGIYFGLVNEGYENITIANRTVQKAKEIIANDPSTIEKHVVTIEEAEENISKYDVIVQTTSVGMKPHINETIISLQHVQKEAIVSDIVYQPIFTKFLQDAKAGEAWIHFGHTMLLYQAALAFSIWTGKHPNTETMDDQLQQILEGD